MTRMSPFWSGLAGELLRVGDDLVSVAGDELGEGFVSSAGGVEVVVGLVKKSAGAEVSCWRRRVRATFVLKSGSACCPAPAPAARCPGPG